jgi:hypothetical protein
MVIHVILHFFSFLLKSGQNIFVCQFQIFRKFQIKLIYHIFHFLFTNSCFHERLKIVNFPKCLFLRFGHFFVKIFNFLTQFVLIFD